MPQAMAPGAFATTALARHPLPTLQAEGAGSRAAGPFLLGDSLMEASRPELRSVFDADSWEALRCTDRYFHHILETHRSRILLGMAKPLAHVAAASAVACACGAAMQAGLLPAFLPALGGQLKELFNLTSFALSLLLVFRTNSSYARWEEGRRLWGQVLNRTRDVCRLGLAWVGEEERHVRALLLRWAPAFSRALMCHLRKGEDLREELEGVLLPYEIDALMQAQHRPNYVLQVLTHAVRAARVPDQVVLRMHDSLAQLEDALGGCERLLQTPVPIFYTRMTSRFLMTWITALPFVLWSTCGLLAAPLSLLISFLLLGIDKIGVSIEEPFSILALSDIADTAAGDVHELADMHGSSPEQQHMPCPELVGASALEPCCCGMHSEGSSSVQPFSEGALAPLAAAAPDSRAPAGGARTAVLVGDGA